jgi:hypothetical protein
MHSTLSNTILAWVVVVLEDDVNGDPNTRSRPLDGYKIFKRALSILLPS